jgi:hypothetical protein
MKPLYITLKYTSISHNIMLVYRRYKNSVRAEVMTDLSLLHTMHVPLLAAPFC